MNASFFQGERLSRKQAKKIYTLATVTSVLYLVAKCLLMVGALLIFWHVIWQIPDAIVKGIQQYFDYCNNNTSAIDEKSWEFFENASTFCKGLSNQKVGLFAGIANFEAFSGQTYEKVGFIIYLLQLISILALVFAPRGLGFLFFKEMRYVVNSFSNLPDSVYGQNYQVNMEKLAHSEWTVKQCKKMLKWIDPNKRISSEGNVTKEKLSSRLYVAKRYIKENRKNFKKERKLFWKNPQTSASLSDAYYYRCIQTTAALWGKDPEQHVAFMNDPLTEKNLEREHAYYAAFSRFVAKRKLKAYVAEYEKKIRNRRAKVARNGIFRYKYNKMLSNMRIGHYSIAKSYNDTFRSAIKIALFSIIPYFAVYLGVISAVAPIKLPVLRWFCLELGGIWYIVLFALGLLFYFILGIMAGRVLNIERVERDEYYRNLKEVKREGRNVFLKEVGRIRKNTTIRRSSLRGIPREYGLTVFTFRNICQILSIALIYVLLIFVIKAETVMYFKNLLDPNATDISLIFVGLKLAAILWILYRFDKAFNYSLSANEFRISTMREDRRRKARVKYRRSMRFIAFGTVGLLVLTLITGTEYAGYMACTIIMALLGLIAATTDWLLRPRDPDEDIGVDFFFNDGNKRDPDDGIYVP